ncbi:MAG TPA: glycosyltransferase family 39 protein [Vicinamibacterales bacterium]|nr:glycosyltransferase family 39 protein [Vicinamibacterales bacterium]
MPRVWAFGICLIAVLGLQITTGAYRGEHGVYSDDAAHFMNALVIRDYLTTGLGQNPLTFAENYYVDFPKIAPLMWPPLFHIALGLVLLPGWPPSAAALVFVALTAAWLVWRLRDMVERLVGPRAGWFAAAALITTPLVQAQSSVIMVDISLAALAIEAAYWLARYAQRPVLRHALLFGCFTACGCLTKGNGVALILMPVIFIVISGRFDLFLRSGLYVAAFIVIVFAGPLLAASATFDAAIGDFGPVTVDLVLARIRFFATQLWIQLGPFLLAMSIAGLIVVIRRRRQGASEFGFVFAQTLAALAVASLGFHLFSPHLVSVSRYLIMTFAPAIALALIAAGAVMDSVPRAGVRPATRLVLAVVMAVAAIAVRPALAIRQPLGYHEVVTRLVRAGELAGKRILIISDEAGEGAAVTEAAIAGVTPRPTIIRGSKLMATDDWNGRGLTLRYASAEALLADLERLQVRHVVVDRSRLATALPYFHLVEEMAAAHPTRLAPVTVQPASGLAHELALYRVTARPGGLAPPIEIVVPSLGRSLSR